MRTKLFSNIALGTLVFLVLWIIFMIIYGIKIGSVDTFQQAINSVINPSWVFYATYINAVIITILVTILFSCLFLYCKEAEPELAIFGLIFVPVYSLLNLFSYFSQITLVPKLVSYQTIESYNLISKMLVAQLVQAWSGSSVAVLNNLAYAVLGIPSITFGIVFLREKNTYGKVSGILLILNAISCIIGFIGIAFSNKIAGNGSLVGGVVFIMAVLFLWLFFDKESRKLL